MGYVNPLDGNLPRFLGGADWLVGWNQVSERQGWKQGQLSRGFLVASSGECFVIFLFLDDLVSRCEKDSGIIWEVYKTSGFIP